ncbi:hypothetical protein L9F63_018770 [Diploptera punctata]|uniref:Uncharacterized protein n=1 Tax=Diploptera punctata TaxID=6984 RepID=A0AAD8EFH0_DIPPU|nr:hypothetical protein L9F63_018770 [Diploptera punctata]
MIWGSTKRELPFESLHYPKYFFSSIQNSPFDNFNNETGVKTGEYIIPNIVHFLFLEDHTNLSYVDAVCILAAFKNQKPDKIYIHTNSNRLEGPHWEKLETTQGLNIELREVSFPTDTLRRNITNIWYSRDIIKIYILMEHGGIFLDNDCYLVRSLDCFRKFEMTIGLNDKGLMGTQTIVAHKDARFLKLWLESYGFLNDSELFCSDAGEVTLEILKQKPELVHSVKMLFGFDDLSQMLYRQSTWKEWRMYHTIHLRIRRRKHEDNWWNYYWWPEFNDNNMENYPMVFGEMARDVYGTVQ